jgi:hypothetical protein
MPGPCDPDLPRYPELFEAPDNSEPLTVDELTEGASQLRSLVYQCSEGNVPETWPEYAAIAEAEKRLRVLASQAEARTHHEKMAKREPAEWVDVREAAKLMRAALKSKWPGVRFSVRIDRYSMGCSTNISWTDGPATREVEAVVGPYSGDRFDGMDDSTYVVQSWLRPDGTATYGDADEPAPAGVKRVRFSGSRPHCSREVSAAWVAKCTTVWQRLDGHAQCELLNHHKFPRWMTERDGADYGRALAIFLGETAAGDADIAARV